MLATEVTENTEIFSFVGAASAANSSRSDGLFAAEAAPTFTVVQIKTTIQAFASVPLWLNVYRINPLSLVKTHFFKWDSSESGLIAPSYSVIIKNDSDYFACKICCIYLVRRNTQVY